MWTLDFNERHVAKAVSLHFEFKRQLLILKLNGVIVHLTANYILHNCLLF